MKTQTCPNCGSTIDSEISAGLCPKCQAEISDDLAQRRDTLEAAEFEEESHSESIEQSYDSTAQIDEMRSDSLEPANELVDDISEAEDIEEAVFEADDPILHTADADDDDFELDSDEEFSLDDEPEISLESETEFSQTEIPGPDDLEPTAPESASPESASPELEAPEPTVPKSETPQPEVIGGATEEAPEEATAEELEEADIDGTVDIAHLATSPTEMELLEQTLDSATPAGAREEADSSFIEQTLDSATAPSAEIAADSSFIEQTLDSAIAPSAEIAADSSFIEQTMESAGDSAIAASGDYDDNPSFSATQKTVQVNDSFAGVGSSLADMPKRRVAEVLDPAQLADYELQEELGKGSFGVVWRARQIALNRTVALKLLHDKHDPESGQTAVQTEEHIRRRTEFLREAQFNGRLDHPNIVPIHELGVGQSGKPFYAMKEIRGISWRKVIKKKTQDENLDILNKVADAMAFSHDKGILHCDLKPDNVMLGEFGEALVVDWGQAIDVSEPDTYRPGGSPAYISPEMAQYFCEALLERKKDPPSRKLVGPRSDVYLIGAMLFEIVTGYPPHPGYKGEKPLDVLKRARTNELRKHEEYADDELMQIALKALGGDGYARYETINEMQSDLRDYESRQRSIEVRTRAQLHLATAKESNEYDSFQRARFGFEEAIDLWDGNEPAKVGLNEARLSFAATALKNEDFDLGLEQVRQPQSEDEVKVQQKLIKGRKTRNRRKKMVFGLMAAFAASILIGSVTALVLINKAVKEQRKAAVAIKDADAAKIVAKDAKVAADVEKARADVETKRAADQTKVADAAKKKADAQTKIAETQTQVAAEKAREAAGQTKLAEEKTKIAAEQTMLAATKTKEAEDAKLLADKQAMLAKMESERAAAEKEKADAAKREAEIAAAEAAEAKENGRLVRFKNAISVVDQRIQAGDYEDARAELNDETIFTKENRSWEWERLWLRTHPEVEDVNKEPVHSVATSADGSTMAWVDEDAIVVAEFDSPKDRIAEINLPNAIEPGNTVRIALTGDGSRLALAIGGDNSGTIQTYKRDGETFVAESTPLTAQSKGLTDLQLSTAGDRMLSVGVPDPRTTGDRSDRGQARLMVWQLEGNEWKKVRPRKGGGDPGLTAARFSDDGNRIVTSVGETCRVLEFVSGSEQMVLNQVGDFEQAGAESNISIFANAAGTEVISGFDKTLVHWKVDSSRGTIPENARVSLNAKAADQLLGEYDKHERPIASLAIGTDSNDQRYIASGESETGIALLWKWDGKSAWKESDPLKGHAGSVDFVALGSNPIRLVTGATGSSPSIRAVTINELQPEIPALTTLGGIVSGWDSSESDLVLFGSDNGRFIGYDKTGVTKASTETRPSVHWSPNPDVASHLVAGEKAFTRVALPPKTNKNDIRTETIYVRNVETGLVERVLDNLPEFRDFAVSGNGQRLAIMFNESLSSDEVNSIVQVYDTSTGQKIGKTLSAGSATSPQELSSFAMKLSHDGKYVVAGFSKLYVWNGETGEGLYSTSRLQLDPQGAVDSVFFVGKTSKFVAAWNNTNWIRVHDAGTGRQPLADYRREFKALVDATDVGGAPHLLLQTKDGFEVAKAGSGESIETIAKIDSGRSASFSLADAGKVVLVDPGKVDFVETPDASPVFHWNWSSGSSKSDQIDISEGIAEVNSDSAAPVRIETATELSDGRLVIRAQKRLLTFAKDLSLDNLRVIPRAPCLYAGQVGPNTIVTLHGAGDSRIRFWEIGPKPAESAETYYRSVKRGKVLAGAFARCEVAPDTKYLMIVSKSGTLTVLDSATLNEVFSFTPDSGKVDTAAWSHDSSHFVAVTSTGKMIAWSAGSKPVAVEEYDIQGMKRVDTLSVSNKLDAIACESKEAVFVLQKLPDPADAEKAEADIDASKLAWKEVKLLDGQQTDADTANSSQSLRSVAVSPDGSRVVTTSVGGTMVLWNTQGLDKVVVSEGGNGGDKMNERRLLELYKHKSPVRFVRFAADGRSLMSAETSAREAVIWPGK